MNTLVCFIVFLAWPSGVAAQSTALCLAIAYGIWLSKKGCEPRSFPPAWTTFSWTFGLFLLLRALSSFLAGRVAALEVLEDVVGYSAVVIVPPYLCRLWNSVAPQRMWRFGVAALSVCAAISVSQVIWQWRLAETHIEFAQVFGRARGFYSHPLTLAYVALTIWPLALLAGLKRQIPGIISLVLTATILVASVSRVALVVALVVAGVAVVLSLQGKSRTILLAIGLTMVTTVASTDNRISRHFSQLFSKSSPDRQSSYVDDRLAFWDAFQVMIQERPLIGHGIDLDRDYRAPYYEKIGLKDFTKKYEAHNQYLQITAEQGFLGLIAFLLVIVATFRMLAGMPRDARRMGYLTLLCFLVGGLTQNAFQDSEVRYSLTILLSFALASFQSTELA